MWGGGGERKGGDWGHAPLFPSRAATPRFPPPLLNYGELSGGGGGGGCVGEGVVGGALGYDLIEWLLERLEIEDSSKEHLQKFLLDFFTCFLYGLKDKKIQNP
ncbi:hypothetical protein Pcinc_044368 [Petrolisthes cinctipes]|uniref:Uncharacterized protein n=1 Tax=Petrolisthes cinctipes TaxID=88211 RepID=A0AAE1BH93_PETCI|nr:hypothetical protein Pcinc_044368 [Petrolisthes cinctipes]